MIEALAVITPATVMVVIVVGLLGGAFFLAEVRARGLAAPISLLVMGLAYFVALSAARFEDGSPVWARNLGSGLLWALFCLCAAFGIAIRRGKWRGL